MNAPGACHKGGRDDGEHIRNGACGLLEGLQATSIEEKG